MGAGDPGNLPGRRAAEDLDDGVIESRLVWSSRAVSSGHREPCRHRPAAAEDLDDGDVDQDGPPAAMARKWNPYRHPHPGPAIRAKYLKKTGGNAWESNPPPTPQPARDNGFEDRERHQPLSASAGVL